MFIWLGKEHQIFMEKPQYRTFHICFDFTFCNPISILTHTFLQWWKTSLAPIQVVIIHLNIPTTELNIIMLTIVPFRLTLSLIQHINFKPSIIRNLMVCTGFTSLEDGLFHISTALPCDVNGKFIPQHTKPPPCAAPDATEDNRWHPFEDRLAFDWAHYHFMELQSSE